MRIPSPVHAAGYLTLWRAVEAMPERLAYKTMESLFARQYRRNGPQVARLRSTFAPIVPPEELERTVEDAFRWYGRYWAEAFRLTRVSSATLTERFSIEGREHLEGAMASGAGAVLATMHLGNWDTGGRWVSERWPMTAVAERLEPRSIFERFLSYRRKLGMGIIALEAGTDVVAQCADRLRRNEFVALLADRDLSGRGVAVEFFGRVAKMAPGPAVLSARTGCQILPAVIYQREDGRHHAVVEAPLEPVADERRPTIARTTQQIACAYERFVRRAPAQWHMFQRYWPDPPIEAPEAIA